MVVNRSAPVVGSQVVLTLPQSSEGTDCRGFRIELRKCTFFHRVVEKRVQSNSQRGFCSRNLILCCDLEAHGFEELIQIIRDALIKPIMLGNAFAAEILNLLRSIEGARP